MENVVVYGAYGHTGRFVLAELRERGFNPILSGRDAAKLRALAAETGFEARPASVEDPASLDQALVGAAAVINCAGPFASTGAPVIEAALRARIPYVDVAAEIEANLDTFAHFSERAKASNAVVVPAMAFYGGLTDLLATVAMGGWTAADQVHIAYGLSSWQPTEGTRASGAVSHERRQGRRIRYTNGSTEYYQADALPQLEWTFPEPLGARLVLGDFSMADIVTIPSHLAVNEIKTYMAVGAAKDLSTSDTAGPVAVDEQGRSAQTFVIDVIVQAGAEQRRVTASGQDIYAVSAPLAVEAVHRILTGQTKTTGVASAGAIFDAEDFLKALSAHLTVVQAG